MKDLSNYTYVELYDMLTHIDQYKYADRLEAVQEELDARKKQGEIPDEIIPKINVSLADLLDFGLIWFSLGKIASGISVFILSIVVIVNLSDELLLVDLLIIALIIVLSIGFGYGGFKMINRHLIGVPISFFSELLMVPVLILAFKHTFIKAFEIEATAVNPISAIPFGTLIILVGLFFLIRKTPERSAKTVFSDLLTFRINITF